MVLAASALITAPGHSPDLQGVQGDVLQRWERVQKRFGQDLPLTSGYRGAMRNRRSGGAKKSQHMHGNALDVDLSSLSKDDRLRLIRIASSEGFNGVGVYGNGVHFDIGGRRAWGPSHKRASVPAWAEETIAQHLGGGFQVADGADQLAGQGEMTFDPERYKAFKSQSAPQGAAQPAQTGGFDPQRYEEFKAAKSQPAEAAQPAESAAPPGIVEIQTEDGTPYMFDTRAFARQRIAEDLGASITGSTGNYLQGLPFMGEYIDEIVGGFAHLTGKNPELQRELARAFQEEFAARNPIGAAVNQFAGGVTGGAAIAGAAGPAVAAAAPSSFAGKTVAGLAGGAALGAAEGFVSGFGAGNDGDRLQSAQERAAIGGALGGALGGLAPSVSKGVQAVGNAFSRNRSGRVAKQQGVAPEAVELTGRMVQNDGGEAAAARLADPDAMPADAGPATAGLLDMAIQKAGPGGKVARDAIDERVQRAGVDLNTALNEVFGPIPTNEAVNPAAKRVLSGLYKRAYSQPINYASDVGREIEGLMSRVPQEVIRRADRLMQVEGVASKQRLITFNEAGEEVIAALPDVRQLDYITRALNDVAKRGDGQGLLGGNTNEGRVFGNLSREIRTALKEAVPEYKTALNRAANEISLKDARDLGEVALRASTSRGDVFEAVADMGAAEITQMKKGVRTYVDDVIAQVRRTMMDADTESREAFKTLTELSSRASQDKLKAILGEKEAGNLVRRMNKAAKAFELRAATAQNSKTFARMSFNEALQNATDPGVKGLLASGQPVAASRRIVQKLTGMSPADRQAFEEKLAGDIATLLTRVRGPEAQKFITELVGALEQDARSAEFAAKLGRAAANSAIVGGSQLPKLQPVTQP